MTRLFVYGSLLKGQPAHDTLKDCEFVQHTRVPGFDLFALTWFPGMVENKDSEDGVAGEIYNLPADENKTADLLTHLDYYEGYFPDNLGKSLFLRQELEICGEPTLVYVFNGNPYDKFGCSARVVKDGNWSQYKGETENAA